MTTFKLPDLGEGLAEAEILAWHVNVGDQVQMDQPMVSVETAKAVVEVPVPFSGTVSALHGNVGDIVPTGAPLIDFDSGTVVGSMPAGADEECAASTVAEAVAVAAPRPREDARFRALPLARGLAKHLGVQLSDVRGSGAAGVIGVDDVLAEAQLDRLPLPASRVVPDGAPVEPLRGLRRAMAHGMSLSHRRVPSSTICDDADIHAWTSTADTLVRLIRALTVACGTEPSLNAWYDPASMSRIVHTRIDLAIAIDTPGGLIAPVLRDVRGQSAAQLRQAVAAHKESALTRSIAAEHLREFTITLSNFGSLAGRYGIPLVMPPSVAILGAGKAREEAVVANGAVRAHRRIPLSLSFDHRCITGGEACKFLAAAIADLEARD